MQKDMANEITERLGFQAVAKYELRHGRAIVPGMGGSGEGYDLASKETDGRFRLIEVKATNKKRPTFRWLEPNEYARMDREENYWVYVVTKAETDPHVRPFAKHELAKKGYKEEVKRMYSFSAADFKNEERA